MRVLLPIALALAGCRSSTPPPPPAERVVAPMPRITGILLEPRMRRHAAELAALADAVHAVDFPRVAVAARTILAEPRLARPAPELGPTVNDEVPAAFFALQDRLIAATRDVEAAAVASDADALDTAFRDLTGTCQACHDLYRAR